MADQGRGDESRPIAYYRSGYLPQAFAYNQLGSIWLLPQAVAGTLPPPYRVRSHVAESRRRIVRDTIIRIVVRVVGWLFMGITEHGGWDVRSYIMRSVVIAITSPFMRHTK
jgi:hypothetical protein